MNPQPRWKVGDWVYWAQFELRQETKTCPVCFDKRRVTVILGDDTQVVVECDYCGKGYEGPRGTVKEYERLPKAEFVRIDGVHIEQSDRGEHIEYQCAHSRPDTKDLFDTEACAIACANEKRLAYEKDEETRADRIKKDLHKPYTWNAGYHMREAKEARRKLKYHEAKAVICKAKAKEPTDA